MTDTGSPPSTDARHRDPEDAEIDLRQYFLLVWRYRLLVVAATVVCALSAFVWGVLTKRTYGAEVALVVSQSKIGERDERPVSTASFRPYIESQSIAAKIIREFGFDKPPHRFFASTFFGSVVTIEEIRNSTVFLLAARLDDPDLAARVVNRVAEMAVAVSKRVSFDEAARSRDDIGLQMDEAQKRLDETEAALRTFREKSQIELLRKDVDSALNERGELLSLLIGIEAEKAKLTKAEQELAARTRIDTVRRTIDSDPALMESARPSASQPTSLLALETRNEFVNPVYEQLDSQVAISRTNLAALEQRKTQIVDVRKLGAPQLAKLSQLYQVEGQLSDLEMQRDLARRVYLEVATAYETARLQVSGRSAQLQIIEPAVAPDQPLSRHVVRTTLAAALVGLMLSVFGVLVYGVLSTEPRNAEP